jgi:hypothetical protein
VEGIVLITIFRVFTIYKLWTGAYGRIVSLLCVMGFFPGGHQCDDGLLGLGLGVSIFDSW